MSWFFHKRDEPETPEQTPEQEPSEPELMDQRLISINNSLRIMNETLTDLTQRSLILESESKKFPAIHADAHNTLRAVLDWHNKFDCLVDALGVVVTSDNDGAAIVSVTQESLLVHARRYLSDQLAMAKAVDLRAREMDKRTRRQQKHGRPNN